MSDEELASRERIARALGEDDPGANRMRARAGLGLEGEVRRMIGLWCYVEGERMNYRGVLVEIYTEISGALEAIVLEPAWRLGWWDNPENGPRQGYHFKLKGRVVIPWLAVHAIHEQFDGWPTK